MINKRLLFRKKKLYDQRDVLLFEQMNMRNLILTQIAIKILSKNSVNLEIL